MWWTLLLATAQAGDPPVSGRWTLADSPQAVAAVHATAVKSALDQLPFAFRPFAKGRLASAVRSCPVLRIDLTAATFASVCEGDREVVRQRAEPTSTWTGEDGKSYRVELTLAADAAALRFTGDEGGQRIEYRPQADGSLVVVKEIFSSYLTSPVPWSVRYRRLD